MHVYRLCKCINVHVHVWVHGCYEDLNLQVFKLVQMTLYYNYYAAEILSSWYRILTQPISVVRPVAAAAVM